MSLGEHCSVTCATRSHVSFGECVRSKGLQVADVTAHQFHKNQNSEVKAYVDARKSGLQPESFRKKDVDTAWKITEASGVPYRADQRGTV